MVNKVNISSNVIKFPSPFERLKSYTNSPDVMLRKAIITQAIIDATNISELRAEKKLAWILHEGGIYKNKMAISLISGHGYVNFHLNYV